MKKLILLSTIVLLANCATYTQPKALLPLDESAKKFVTEPGKANIYIYREKGGIGFINYIQTGLDGYVCGWLALSTFIHLSVDPGQHIISGRVVDYWGVAQFSTDPNVMAEYLAPIRHDLSSRIEQAKFEAEEGKNYFFKASITPGLIDANCYIKQVEEKEGKKKVINSKLMEKRSR